MDKKDQIVYVKDLLFAALYRWRSILVCSLILAILLGGFTAYTGLKDMKASANVPQTTLTADQQSKKLMLEQDIARLEAQIAAHKAYLEESPLMQLDPTAVNVVNLDVYVKTASPVEQDNTPELLYGYMSALGSANMSQIIADTLQIPQRYALDLILLNKPTDSTRIVTVKIYGESEENAIKILDAVENFILQNKQNLTETIGDHEISLVRGNVLFGKDTQLNSAKITTTTNMTTALDTLASQQKQLSTLNISAPQRISKSAVLKDAIIFAILGAMAGAGMVVGIAWFFHLAGSKVYSARTFKNRTNLNVLSCVSSDKKLFAVDKLLRTAEGRNLDDAQTAITAAIVSTCCGSNNRLMLVGNCNTQSWEPLSKELESAGLQVYCAGSLLQNAAAIKQLPNYENILLIEQCGCSSYTDVNKTISVTADLGKQLMGCVLIDG